MLSYLSLLKKLAHFLLEQNKFPQGVIMAFHTSLTGLNAASTKLATTSNNIANAATDTFKRSDVQFADIYAKSSRSAPTSTIGQGALTANITQQHSQGALSNTNRSLDLAISGNGFYMTRPLNNAGNEEQIVYTRGGSFTVDPQNFVINNSGDRLLAANPANPGELIELNIPPRTVDQFNPTTTIAQQINLPNSASPPDINDFDRATRGSYNFSSNLTFINNIGESETATVYYIKDPKSNPESNLNSFQTRLFIGDEEFTPQGQTSILLDAAKTSIGIRDIEWEQPSPGTTLIAKEGPFIVGTTKYIINNDNKLLRDDPSGPVHIGNLIKNEGGFVLNIFSSEDKERIKDLDNADYLSLTEISEILNASTIKGMIQAQKTIEADGRLWFDDSGKMNAASSNLVYNINGQEISIQRPNTQISSGGFNIFSQEQDGQPDGDLIGMRVETNGDVFASYANGQDNLIGSLRLTTFANPSGLRQIGDTRYLYTEAAGNFNVGIPGTEGFGLVQSGSIERSNVDLTTELVDLIMAQRNFQANSKAIEIDNTMTKSIIDSVRN